MKIITNIFEYEFEPLGDGTGLLSGGKIHIPDKVVGFFEQEPVVGGSPVFIFTEPCLLLYDNEEVYIRQMGGLMLSNIQSIEMGD